MFFFFGRRKVLALFLSPDRVDCRSRKMLKTLVFTIYLQRSASILTWVTEITRLTFQHIYIGYSTVLHSTCRDGLGELFVSRTHLGFLSFRKPNDFWFWFWYSIVLARRKAPYCEVNLCQFVDAKVMTTDLVIVHFTIDCWHNEMGNRNNEMEFSAKLFRV